MSESGVSSLTLALMLLLLRLLLTLLRRVRLPLHVHHQREILRRLIFVVLVGGGRVVCAGSRQYSSARLAQLLQPGLLLGQLMPQREDLRHDELHKTSLMPLFDAH